MKPGSIVKPNVAKTITEKINAEKKRIAEMKKAKPDLIIKPNHFKYIAIANRVYNIGIARRDGNGWYK